VTSPFHSLTGIDQVPEGTAETVQFPNQHGIEPPLARAAINRFRAGRESFEPVILSMYSPTMPTGEGAASTRPSYSGPPGA